MPARLVLSGFVILARVAVLAAGEDFPYAAYVKTDLAPIHGGPGLAYYATDGLPKGSQVDVYRHDAGGWCAIRPPEGSFGWIEQDLLKATSEPGVFAVTVEGTLSRVGTRLGDDHDHHQVCLRSGELVEVLETATLEETDGQPTRVWAKIAPPSGEFRWIQSRHICRQPLRRAAEEAVTRLSGSEPHLDEPPAGLGPDQAWVEAAGPPSDVAVTSFPSPEKDTADDQDAAATPALVEPASKPAVSAKQPPASNSPPPSPTAGALAFRDAARPRDSRGLTATELDEIDVQLSQTVTQDPALWKLDGLQSRTEAVIDTCGAASQRDRARELLGVIVQFQDLQRRHQRLASSTGSTVGVAPDGLTTYDGRTVRGPAVTAGDGNGPYDGTGWLMPLVAQRAGLPQYALTDRNGRILQLVTASPGVNLRRYQREEIGIIGRQGYVPQLGRPHLVAERVVVLSRHRR